ncbi:MAG: DUF1573 domain-containing protein [Bacteroidetes bacterium]|nr:MAG: DUF1573 domain-containing protein [Bacteroidota bacterium]
MKKVLFLSAIFCLMAFFANAQSNLGAFGWSKTTHEFGKITQGTPVTATFEFTNTGKSDLIISNAKGSCGCTGTTFPKEPIAPGKKATITATFNAASPGAFHKTVTVTANTEEVNSILNIKGEVGATSQQ